MLFCQLRFSTQTIAKPLRPLRPAQIILFKIGVKDIFPDIKLKNKFRQTTGNAVSI